jgi:hypothetical protein
MTPKWLHLPTVNNPDVLNPILYSPTFGAPHIEVGANASILAAATFPYTSGDVTLAVNNTNYTLDGLSFPTINGVVRTSSVTFDDASSGKTTVTGGNITITATSGDVPVVATFLSHQGENTNNEWGSWGQWVGGAISSVFQVANLPILKLASLPVSINYRSAGSTVTVGENASIVGSGTVNVQASSTADAEGQAIYAQSTTGGAAIAVMLANTDAETDVKANALIESTGGDVDVGSTANSTTVGTARVTQNTQVDDNSDPNKSIQVSLAVGSINQTAHATLEAGASLEANGSSSNSSNPASTSYQDGKAGIAAVINVAQNDIRANADGTIISGIVSPGSTSPAATDVPFSVSFNPFTDVDFANNAIRVSSSNETAQPSPPGQAPVGSQWQTGQQIVYNSGGGGSIPGLVSGTVYYVIVPSNLTNEIQLAASLTDALSDTPIQFNAYPTLSDGTITVPITDVDESTGTINFGFKPGFTDGEQLTYKAAANQRIGGLTDGKTYYAIITSANPTGLQLSLSAPSNNTDGPAIPLTLNPDFAGFRQNLPVTVNPTGGLANSLKFGFNTGFTANDHFVYQGSGIAGLSDGVTYWVLPDANDPSVIQLATSPGGQPVAIGLGTVGTSGSATLTFDPSVSLDTDNNTVDLGFNYALAGNLAVPVTVNPSGGPTNSLQFGFNPGLQLNDHFTYQGSGIAGLTRGTIYYVIPDANDPTIIQLATSTQDSVVPIGSHANPSGRDGAATFTFGPDVTLNADFNFALAGTSSNLPSGTALVYHGALQSNVADLTDGATYYVIQDPASPRIMYLGNDAADAEAAYAAGASAYQTNYATAYTTAYNNWLANHPNDTAGAVTAGTTAANAAAGTGGTSWTSGAIADYREGTPPPVGTFTVSVNTTSGLSNTIDFGFNGGFVNKDPLVYVGPVGTNPGINGLTPGTIYYINVPDPLNNPSVIQLTDSSGNVIPISLTSGTTTMVQFGSLTNDSITVSGNTLTFNTPGDPTTPFDPGYQNGDPFVYEGPVTQTLTGDVSGTTVSNLVGTSNLTPGMTVSGTGIAAGTTILSIDSDTSITLSTAGATGRGVSLTFASAAIATLAPGTTYYVILTGTPGVIQLAPTPGGSAISFGPAFTTNINYTVPFAPADDRPYAVTHFGGIDTSYMTGTAHTLEPVNPVGININASLSSYETNFASSGIGGKPSWTDRLTKPEQPSLLGNYLQKLMTTAPDPNSTSSAASTTPANTLQSIQGGTGNSPPWSVVGTFVIMIDLSNVYTDIAGTAVLESASDVTASSSLSQTADTGRRPRSPAEKKKSPRARPRTPPATAWPSPSPSASPSPTSMRPSMTALTSMPRAPLPSAPIPPIPWRSPPR